MNNTVKKTLLVCLLAIVLMLSACTTTDPTSTTAQAPATTPPQTNPASTQAGSPEPADPGEALEPLEISIIVSYDGVEFPQAGNPAQTAMEEYTNTKLNITAYPGSTLHEMLPTMIASDELPMAVGFGGSQLTKTYMINAMEMGVFWDVTDYISQFPNIAQISDITYDTYRINGRNYGLPKERGLSRDAVGYRYDWIQNLGIKEPTTLDELIETMIAFTENDPDGNGKNDTYGTCNSPLGRIALYLGGPNTWKYENGQMIRNQFTAEYQEALDIMRGLYEKGVIHPEYAILSRSQYEALWTEGRAGMYFNINNFAQFAMAEEHADVHVNNIFPSKNGTFTSAGTGHNGVIAISTKAVPEEETFLRILGFFDKLGDEEMCNLLALGFEGEHYNVVDGKAVPVADMQDDQNQRIYMPYAAPIAILYPDIRTMPVERNYLQSRILEVLNENLPYAVANPTTGLISESYNELGADLDTLLSDADTQYVMGIITKDEYLSRLDQWKSRGGDKIAAEYAQAYENSKN